MTTFIDQDQETRKKMKLEIIGKKIIKDIIQIPQVLHLVQGLPQNLTRPVLLDLIHNLGLDLDPMAVRNRLKLLLQVQQKKEEMLHIIVTRLDKKLDINIESVKSLVMVLLGEY
jgi:hypothetical protein